MKKLFKELQTKGWSVTHCSKHTKLRHPDFGLVTCSLTPSCPFVEKKIRADIKRKENLKK